MNTTLDLYLPIRDELSTYSLRYLEKYFNSNNSQNVKFIFVQTVKEISNYTCYEFYVKGSSRKIIDKALKELSFNDSKKYQSIND